MDELIIKYLTDRLDAEENKTFAARLESDPAYRREFELTAVALSVADMSLDGASVALDWDDSQIQVHSGDEKD